MIKRQVIFVGVGVFNTVADYGLFMLLVMLLGLGAPLAGVISATVMMVVSFFLHKNLTWRDRGADNKVMWQFLLGTAVTMWAVRPVLMWCFEMMLDPLVVSFMARAESLEAIIGTAVVLSTLIFGFSTVVTLVLNYIFYNKIVFNPKKPRSLPSLTEPEKPE
ncbi:GtrA family protein [Candidatus Saccharibacteria bacterium]|nr:GtrA family protein [Candidatus Saccharibacteria bacterium]